MTAHTPGPWTLQELPHDHDFRTGVNYTVRDAWNCCLAQVGHVDALHDGEETEANARLIAAAPELLEALRKWIARVDLYYLSPARVELDDLPNWGQDMAKARAAIAKATGAQP